MNQKKNLRFQETDKKIRDYFLAALSERSVAKITVQEICAAVGINRSSFYLHYRDVFDILEQMSEDYVREMLEEIAAAKIDSPYIFSRPYMVLVLRHIAHRAVFYCAYLENVGLEDIEKGYRILFETIFKPYFQQLGIESERQMLYYFSFTKSGFLSVVREWLRFGCPETPEALSDIILSCMPELPADLPAPII